MLKHRVVGYLYGVGLQIEEPPITTIVPKHRVLRLKEGRALTNVLN